MPVLLQLSTKVAKAEIAVASMLAGFITLLIIFNVVTRSLNYAIYWVDEAAIYAMAWMTFLAASAAIHHGKSVSVTIATDFLPEKVANTVLKGVDICVFLFAALMVWLCWRWYLPFDLVASDFDIEKFQGDTFNFIYAEPTTTLGMRKFWVWSVMWLFSLGMLLHATANLFSTRSGSSEREHSS